MIWYENEVQRLEKERAALTYEPKLLFYGSSSIRLWDSLNDDFADYQPVNLGFGGSTLAASDWLPTAVLTSPEGNTPAAQMAASMKDYFKDFSDLHVTIKNVFASPDGKKLAIEWDWAITRRKDGKRGVSHDAIIVDLQGAKIASWREYYDPAASGEANP